MILFVYNKKLYKLILFFAIFQILVEFDDTEWETREWLSVYKDNKTCQLLAVEKSLVLANRSSGPQQKLGHLHPALVRNF